MHAISITITVSAFSYILIDSRKGVSKSASVCWLLLCDARDKWGEIPLKASRPFLHCRRFRWYEYARRCLVMAIANGVQSPAIGIRRWIFQGGQYVALPLMTSGERSKRTIIWFPR